MQKHRSVADERVVLNLAAFEMHDVADRAARSDAGRMFADRMEHRTVLDRRLLADRDRTVIGTNHRAGPDRALGADPGPVQRARI